MGYVKQRADLLDGDTLIPLFDNWDDAMTDQKSFKHIELNYWLKSYGQDDEGKVFTPLGIFLSIDLDYADELPEPEKFCADCEQSTAGDADARHYKYEPSIWLCGACHDDRMEDN